MISRSSPIHRAAPGRLKARATHPWTFLPLRFGACSSLLEGFTPQRLLQNVAETRVTVLFCAATTYKLLLQIPDLERAYDLSSLRLCVSAGEPLPRAVYDEWMARVGVEILDSLGTTEMFHVFVCQRPGAV